MLTINVCGKRFRSARPAARSEVFSGAPPTCHTRDSSSARLLLTPQITEVNRRVARHVGPEKTLRDSVRAFAFAATAKRCVRSGRDGPVPSGARRADAVRRSHRAGRARREADIAAPKPRTSMRGSERREQPHDERSRDQGRPAREKPDATNSTRVANARSFGAAAERTVSRRGEFGRTRPRRRTRVRRAGRRTPKSPASEREYRCPERPRTSASDRHERSSVQPPRW